MKCEDYTCLGGFKDKEEHCESLVYKIKYDDDELPTIFASIQTHQLNDVQRLVFRHPFY